MPTPSKFISSIDYRKRLLFAIVSVSVFTFLILSINHIMLTRKLLLARVDTKINLVGRILAREAAENLIRKDIATIREILEISDAQPNVEFVSVVDNVGIVKYSSITSIENILNPNRNSRDLVSEKGTIYVKSFPIISGGTVLGIVQIGYSLLTIHQDLNKSLEWDGLLGFMVLCIILGVSWKVSGVLLRPLTAMKEVSQNIAKGDFNVRLTVESRDIIGQLSASLNNMASQLGDLTNNMNSKVEKATANLEMSNMLLQQRTLELEDSNAKLKQLDKLKSGFVSMVSHELRTPLTSIIGFAHTLSTLPLETGQKTKYLKIIESEGKRLAWLIDEYLDVTKIEAGSFQVKKEEVDLFALLLEVLETFNIHTGKRIDLRVSNNLPKILGDKDRLKQVFLNLIDNAIKYSTVDGKVMIWNEVMAGELIMHISDEGSGIPEEDLNKVFDKFFRAKDIVTEKTQGSGLGLFIAKGIVEGHNGRIWLNSETGKGVTVSFALPLETSA